jgi:spermidine synthase
MIPWAKLGSARAPDGTEMTLWKRGDEMVVRAGGHDLMSTRVHGSEELLAEHGCEGLGPGACVLIGGLGVGFTLRATLRMLPAKAKVVVAELIPEMVEWFRGPMGGSQVLADRRVIIDQRDVAVIIREATARFDAILLDTDNGPRAPILSGNRWLYGPAGLAAAKHALRPGGRLAIWSANDEKGYDKVLGRAGFEAHTEQVRAHRAGPGGRGTGARQAIFIGVLSGADTPSRTAPGTPRTFR